MYNLFFHLKFKHLKKISVDDLQLPLTTTTNKREAISIKKFSYFENVYIFYY